MKAKLTRVLSLALALVIMLALASCGTSPSPSPTPGTDTSDTSTPIPSPTPDPTQETISTVKKVGVSMPTMDLQRWNQDGNNMKEMFEAAGYEVDLQFGANDEAQQIAQIENMISGGCGVLVIAAITSTSLTNVLATAKDQGILVISYDRLIENTDAVSYYATFDNWKVGTLQGTYLEEKLNLKAGGGPYNIEFFTGDPGDTNIRYFYGGALEVLQPYLDSGVLNCLSGQTERDVVATKDWSSENSQARMENLISQNGYSPSGTKLDAVMCSNDSTAQGVTTALVNAGYTKDNFPLITGQDCDIVSVKNMVAGLQSMSVFKDTRTLAAKVVEMVGDIFDGNEPDINDTETYNNGVFVVPAFLCDPVFGSLDNYEELLIDSGYYTTDQLQ